MYVAASGQVIAGNENDVPLDGPIIVDNVAAADWLTPEHRAAHAAEGTQAFLALPLHHRGGVIGTLVFYFRRTRTFGATEVRAAERNREPRGRGDRDGRGVRGAGAARGAPAPDRRGERAARRLARLRDDACERRRARRARRSPTGASSTSSATRARSSAWPSPTENPAKLEQAKALIAKLPIDPNDSRGVPAVIRTKQPELLSEISDDFLEERFADRPGLAAELRSLGLRSVMTVPLVARGTALGAITLAAGESGRTYGEEDLAMALDLGRRAAAAVDNALLYREAILNESQVRFLAEADAVLNESLDYAATLERLARLAVPQVADWCIVDVVEGADIRRVAVAADDDEKQAALEELRVHYPPTWDSPQPAARALRRGWAGDVRGVRPPGARGHRDRRAAHADHPDPRPALGGRDPADGPVETVGAMTFAWSQTRRRYGERDLPLMEDLAARAALAVDNARLYERERSTGDPPRVPRGDELAAGPRRSTTRPRSRTWRTSSCRSSPTGARSTSSARTVRSGRLAVVHKDPEKADWAVRSRDVHPPTPGRAARAARRVIRTGEPMLYRRITDELLQETARFARALRVLRELGDGVGDGRADERAAAGRSAP